jgi:hypothetical protein
MHMTTHETMANCCDAHGDAAHAAAHADAHADAADAADAAMREAWCGDARGMALRCERHGAVMREAWCCDAM